MKPDKNHIKISQPKEDIKTPLTPSSANSNFHCWCPDIKRVGHMQNLNQREEMALPQMDTILSLAQESHVTDFCNGNVPRGGSPSEGLHGWSVEKPCGKHTEHNGRNKQWSQEPQEILPSKMSTNTSKDILNKDIFLFWAKKADDSNNKGGPKVSDSKKAIEAQQRMIDSHPRPSKAGVGCMKGRHLSLASTSPKTTQRKTWRELFPNPEVFRQLDAHVLHVSSQLKPKPAPKSIQTIVPLITEEAKSHLEKARAIWVWLCHNIEYDVDGFLGLSEKIHTPEQVLQTGRGVCSGYAHLYREMCKEAGLTCVEVSGHGRGAGYSQGQSYLQKKSNHMWNAVKLEDQWFLLDACWGAGLLDVEKRLFVPSGFSFCPLKKELADMEIISMGRVFSEPLTAQASDICKEFPVELTNRHDDFFFLTDPEDFIHSHWPDQPEWQLLQPPISLEFFEDRVYKTPEFFKLQLALLSPDTSVLRTDQGEAKVSLASTLSTEFTYQLLKLCHKDNKEDIGKSHGMLTMSEKKMVLRVFPPIEGLFDLQIFARPSSSRKPYAWVCSYQIECSESNGKELLPKNPFSFWGLHPKAREFGIEGCNWEEALILTTRGVLMLALKTHRPLLATYEFVHQDLDDTLSRKCLVSQSEESRLSCHVVCPFLGYYRLSVFIKGLSEGEFKNTANFLIHCSGPINQNELFPSGLSTHCGTGISSQWWGLSNPSHTSPIINTLKGQCNITFHTQPSFEVTATLEKDNVTNETYPMERYVFITHLCNKVSVSVLLPESGIYRVGLYGRNGEGEEFTHICDYVIRCFADPQWLPFPKVYSSWRRGCVLLHPRMGILQEKSWVRFRVKMPKAYSAHVIGHSRTVLKMGQNKVWEGDVYTGLAGTTLKVAVKFSHESSSMDVILSFDVASGIASGSGDSSG